MEKKGHRKESRRKEVIETNDGIPITTHDIQGHTTRSELRMYRAISIGAAAGVLIFIVLELIPGVTYFSGIFAAAALLCAAIFLAFYPFTWGWDRERTVGEADAVAALNQRRASSFWYERGAGSDTPEAIYDQKGNVVRPAAPPEAPEERPSP